LPDVIEDLVTLSLIDDLLPEELSGDGFHTGA